MNYQQQALAGKNGVELIVALYDGMIRFLYGATECIAAGDVSGRRRAIKRVFDILVHLQGRLRMDVGGSPAKALSEFYAAMFAMALRGSQHNSKETLLEAIACIRTVRDAWQQVALDPAAQELMPRDLQTLEERMRTLPSIASHRPPSDSAIAQSTRWTA